MSFTKDLIGGADGKFDHNSLSALQKVTLRAVVMSFLFYGLASIEGMIMRMVEKSYDKRAGVYSARVSDADRV